MNLLGYTLTLILSIVSLITFGQSETPNDTNTGPVVHVSVGVNTFPSELISMIELHTNSPWSFFIGADIGNQRELDFPQLRFDADNCYIRPLVDTLALFESYSDLSAGLGYHFSSSKRGLLVQLGAFTRIGGQETFSEHDGAINMGILGRIAYKNRLTKRLLFSIGTELNLVQLTHLNCDITDFPVFDLDLIQIRLAYEIGKQ